MEILHLKTKNNFNKYTTKSMYTLIFALALYDVEEFAYCKNHLGLEISNLIIFYT